MMRTITIEVGNDPYVKVFRAHMVILHYRSPYLQRILSTNKKKNDGTLTHIKLPNILPEIFQIILRYENYKIVDILLDNIFYLILQINNFRYIYGGKLSLNKYDISDIIKILVAASELSLQELTTYLQSFLIEIKKTGWSKILISFIK
jgi:BTB/POZ domain